MCHSLLLPTTATATASPSTHPPLLVGTGTAIRGRVYGFRILLMGYLSNDSEYVMTSAT